MSTLFTRSGRALSYRLMPRRNGITGRPRAGSAQGFGPLPGPYGKPTGSGWSSDRPGGRDLWICLDLCYWNGSNSPAEDAEEDRARPAKGPDGRRWMAPGVQRLDKLLLGDRESKDQATKDGLQQTVVNA